MNDLFLRMLPFALILVLMSFGLGLTFQTENDYGQTNLAQTIVLGTVAIFAVFELTALPCIFLHTSFTFLTDLFWKISSALSAVSFLAHFRKLGKSLRKRNLKHDAMLLVFLPVILLVAFQVYIVFHYAHLDEDDAYFVATSVTSLETDTLFVYDCYTGLPAEALNFRYVFSPFFLLYGVCAIPMKMAPAVIAHSFFPLVLIPFTYGVCYLWAEYLFPGKKLYQMLFLLFTALLNLYGNYSVYSSSTFLLTRIWQGKALLCSALLPLLILLTLSICQNREKHYSHISLTVTVIACCLSSSMAVALVPICIGIFCLLSLIYQKRLFASLRLLLCVTPCIPVGIAYLFDKLNGGIF